MSHIIILNCNIFIPSQIKSFISYVGILLFITSHIYSQHGLKAEYYDGTDFNRLEAVRYVPNINQTWYDIPPVPDIDPHECSIRWTGKLKTGKSGTYSFSAQVDDGIRVWIDDILIIDQWDLNDWGVFEGTKELTANREYNLKVEYFNGMLEGEVRLLWKMHKEELTWYERLFGDGIEFAVIPSAYFLPPEEPIKSEIKPVKEVKKKVKLIAVNKKTKTIPAEKKSKIKKTVQKSTSLTPKEVMKPTPVKTAMNEKVAEKFIPKNIQFQKGKTVILESSFPELDAFIAFMLDHPQLKVKVEGHTDVIGDEELNLQLSEDRAKVISDYLVENGVRTDRIESKGFGGSRPLVVSEKGKYNPENRRVVFIIEGF